MAADWLIVDSSNIDSWCGAAVGYTPADALDGVSQWTHNNNEVHWFVLDLGVSYSITKVRGWSYSYDDPIIVDIYISDDKGDWGTAVVEGISDWQDSVTRQEHVFAAAVGRYVKVIVNDTEDAKRILQWGAVGGGNPIFDVYGELYAPDVDVSPSTLELELTLLTPTVFANCTVSPSTLELELTLQAVTTSSVSLSTALPDTFALELSLLTPTVTTVYDCTVSVDVLELELSLHSPVAGGITNATVTPSTFELELDLLTPTIYPSNASFSATTFTLYLNLRSPVAGVFFPTLDTAPKIEGFTDEYSDATQIVDFTESGRPVINPQFTFDSKTFRFSLRHVSQTDKETIEAFYVNNKSNTFFWINEQDNTTYAVIFISKPKCETDGEKEEWKLDFALQEVE